MNADDLLFEFQVFAERMRDTILSKNQDYNGDNTDRLACFKSAGLIAGGDAMSNVMNLIATKATRAGSLLRSHKPNHESIADTALDLANYSFFLHVILKEKQNDKDNKVTGGTL